MAAHPNQAQIQRRFIKLAEVKTLTTLSTSEIYRRIAAGTFPAQVPLGPKSVAWLEAEVLAWCDSLIAQREVA
ncbi:helix-turn-helix transcriptional regulator [Pseudomonas sp. GLN_6]|uniref:helix-turn-helix transcriptional regulator n=1 Tax=Pseudomonas sp. GLN_6 TaxID=3367183 RepID=UPI00370CE14B